MEDDRVEPGAYDLDHGDLIEELSSRPGLAQSVVAYDRVEFHMVHPQTRLVE